MSRRRQRVHERADGTAGTLPVDDGDVVVRPELAEITAPDRPECG
jgi:hypothetical protein